MAPADSGDRPSAAVNEHLRAVEELCARPFPEEHGRDGALESGPGHHLLVLRTSQDFWDDHDGEASRQAAADQQVHLDALVVALADRWGEPTTVDLYHYLKKHFNGALVPEPINALCKLTTTMRLWPRTRTDRWLALAIGQEDKELPIELLAAVGETRALRLSSAGKT
ncbi:hypothetical protein [Glycomyces sp. NPDC048151]|uniref:hypothetical protein n=1 Tax=Glycomyces sp. NPDC048151 TaxID=3364002 RepID=UPI0037220196